MTTKIFCLKNEILYDGKYKKFFFYYIECYLNTLRKNYIKYDNQ